MTTIDYATAKARVEAVAKARPDHTTGGFLAHCYYLEQDGTPSCLVGTAFYPEIREAITPESEINGLGIDALVDNGILSLTPKARYFLDEAQSTQDRGDSWLTAFEYATASWGEEYDENGKYIGSDV